MKWRKRFKKTAQPEQIHGREQEQKQLSPFPAAEVPDGLVRKCNHCKKLVYTQEVREQGYICPKCGGYFRVHARRRVEMIVDEGSFEEWDVGLDTPNPLDYPGYEKRLTELKARTGLDEAVITGRGRIQGQELVLGICDGRFLMASMGYVVGEKLTRAVERATAQKLPVVLFACSGGARMQEGMTSLMQMAKTAAALERHSKQGQLFISVLTDPTMGGVTASFAMLGDYILAEPGALVGFAGPRVISQTIGQKLPEGFQRSEFLLEHGFVDQIVKRSELRKTLGELLQVHGGGRETSVEHSLDKSSLDISNIESCPPPSREGIQEAGQDAWDCVERSRQKDRPVGEDYLHALFQGFVECHGDRLGGDDPALVGGTAWFHGEPVTVLVQMKGHDTRENVERNFAMVSPEGYRKALRLMKQAEKFHRPVICLVDTPGAFCGMEAEEHGQGEAIARNLAVLSDLQVPVLSIVIGEGGSGGALALAVADQVWMLEHSIYSILSPEGYASILWKDAKRAREAAERMKLTARDLYEMGMIEEVIPEPQVFTWETMEPVTQQLSQRIFSFLQEYGKMDVQRLLEQRYERFRKF